jgi:hypothetical protein
MNFYEIGPRRDAEMLPEPKASFLRVPAIQTCPLAHQGVLPIRADDPAALNPA